MEFTKLALEGAYLIDSKVFKDDRGSFYRQFCTKELEEHGINFNICQCNISTNTKAGVLRGLHYQKHPYLEPKLVSCLTGKLFDVIVDLRPQSPTYLKWDSCILEGLDNKTIFIPPMVAHGFQTLEDNTTVMYQTGEFFKPEYYAGVRWNDPKLNIKWPACQNMIINERDNSYEYLK